MKIKFAIIATLLISLSSCDSLSKAIPSFGTNQSISKTESNSVGNGIGKIDSKMKFAEDKSNEFNDSNVTQSNETLTNDTKNDTGNGAKLAGILKDDSINTNLTKSQTKNSTDDDRIGGDQQIFNNINEIQLLIIVISIMACSLLAGVIFGHLIPTRRQNKTYDKAIDVLFRGYDK